jgi:formylglycine-generating enzyme required for sulfatase activity
MSPRCVRSLVAIMLAGSTAAAEPPHDQSACCAPMERAGLALAAARSAAPGFPRTVSSGAIPPGGTSSNGPSGMVWIAGGEFSMGSTDPLARADEGPVHRVRVDGFWIDATEVTNAQFRTFVAATGYKTIAERPVDWEELKKQVPEGTPKPADEMLRPGSLVFTPPDHPVDLRAYEQWWSWTTGADWGHPEGPTSTIEGKDDYPVVQVAYVDALAYCNWAGKSLPTEAQWEYAARGGLDHKINAWGDEPVDAGRANTWQGHFPDKNSAEDGFARAAPVKSFPANGYGLYDVAGNVWEWCSDLYRPDTYARRVLEFGQGVVATNPAGPASSLDPRNPYQPESRVHRGGSFLCNDSYCASYRPSARMACPPDTGLQHLGFRCVMTQERWEKHRKDAAAIDSVREEEVDRPSVERKPQ